MERGKRHLPIVPHPLSFFPSPLPPHDVEASAEERVAVLIYIYKTAYIVI